MFVFVFHAKLSSLTVKKSICYLVKDFTDSYDGFEGPLFLFLYDFFFVFKLDCLPAQTPSSSYPPDEATVPNSGSQTVQLSHLQLLLLTNVIS